MMHILLHMLGTLILHVMRGFVWIKNGCREERPADEELLVEYPGGTIVSGVMDEIRDDYDYIGMDEPLYRKKECYILLVQDVIHVEREEIGARDLLALNGREMPKRIMDRKKKVIWGPLYNEYKFMFIMMLVLLILIVVESGGC